MAPRISAQTTTYLGVVMIVAIWGEFVIFSPMKPTIAPMRTDCGKEAIPTRVFEEYISRAISGIDGELLVLRKLYAQDPAHFDFDN